MHILRFSPYIVYQVAWYSPSSRIATLTGAFRTSPVESLYVEANEPSLENRRIKLGMQYATKLKAYPSNPAYDYVLNPLYENVYDKQPNTIQPFGLPSKITLWKFWCNIVIPENSPWLNPKPTFNFELTQYKKIWNKSFTNSATFCCN